MKNFKLAFLIIILLIVSRSESNDIFKSIFTKIGSAATSPVSHSLLLGTSGICAFTGIISLIGYKLKIRNGQQEEIDKEDTSFKQEKYINKVLAWCGAVGTLLAGKLIYDDFHTAGGMSSINLQRCISSKFSGAILGTALLVALPMAAYQLYKDLNRKFALQPLIEESFFIYLGCLGVASLGIYLSHRNG